MQTGTVQDQTDLPARSKKCTAAGKPAIVVQRYENQDEATNAVALGRADAVLADLPVIIAATNKVPELKRVGENYDTAPYGIAMAEDVRHAQGRGARRGEGAHRRRDVQGGPGPVEGRRRR